MKQEFVDLSKYRLKKAKITLEDAQKFIGEASLESIVNRTYYAMFYAVSSLLIIKELYSSKHSGIRSLFNREIVNKGFMGKQDGEFYSDMFERRQKGDYKDFTTFEKEDVEEWLKKAEEFINKIEEVILKNLEEKRF